MKWILLVVLVTLLLLPSAVFADTNDITGLTDDEVQEELEQIALERQMLEESSFAASGNTEPYPSGGTGNQDEPVDELVDEPTDDDDMI